MIMVRMAYFGTNGHSGHYAIPLRGQFTEAELREIEDVDTFTCCSSFFNRKEKNFIFFGFRNYSCIGFPASLDDKRGGSKTIFLVEDSAMKIAEIIDALNEFPQVKEKFDKLGKLYLREDFSVDKLKYVWK